jgi:predicted aldo/keto reductase-like oxidoreductase
MQYRENVKNGDRVSALAFGCMRFPKDDGEAAALVRHAIEAGVNYFDTAYMYAHNEERLGRFLAQDGLRDRVYIATKIPPYLVRKPADFERIFATELERLQTDHVDYLMMHMLTTPESWQRMVDFGVWDWVAEKKAAGQVRQFGFSFHGGKADFETLVDAEDWDFCMIQLNYLDENNQAGVSGLERAAARGIPVMIMEPLRGGKLAIDLPPAAAAVWDGAVAADGSRRSAAEWGLRWVWNRPEVLTVLSGMNTVAMLDENVRVAGEAGAGELTPQELAYYGEARTALLGSDSIGCTGCGYCMPCPEGVDIPLCFSAYNDRAISGNFTAQYQYALRAGHHNAGRCTRCGRCEGKCPQALSIRDDLARVSKTFEGPLYRVIHWIAKRVFRA